MVRQGPSPTVRIPKLDDVAGDVNILIGRQQERDRDPAD